MQDYLVRVIAKEAGIRGLACMTTELVNEARERHQTSPGASVILARALTGAALMGALLKVRQRVALKFEGSGPIRKVITESDSYGKVRGYTAVPNAVIPPYQNSYDVVSGLGQAGLLTVVKDLRLKELAEGIVPLATSDIAGDLTAYLEQSEQIPSEVAIGEVMEMDGSIAVSGGLLVQALPPYTENNVDLIRERLQELPPLSALLQSGKTPQDILALTFEGITYELLEERSLQFKCTCSRERSRFALYTLGVEELNNILKTEGQAMIDCHFCHKQYIFEREELETIRDAVR